MGQYSLDIIYDCPFSWKPPLKNSTVAETLPWDAKTEQNILAGWAVKCYKVASLAIFECIPGFFTKLMLYLFFKKFGTPNLLLLLGVRNNNGKKRIQNITFSEYFLAIFGKKVNTFFKNLMEALMYLTLMIFIVYQTLSP